MIQNKTQVETVNLRLLFQSHLQTEVLFYFYLFYLASQTRLVSGSDWALAINFTLSDQNLTLHGETTLGSNLDFGSPL